VACAGRSKSDLDLANREDGEVDLNIHEALDFPVIKSE
jgi:hypothetical protein